MDAISPARIEPRLETCPSTNPDPRPTTPIPSHRASTRRMERLEASAGQGRATTMANMWRRGGSGSSERGRRSRREGHTRAPRRGRYVDPRIASYSFAKIGRIPPSSLPDILSSLALSSVMIEGGSRVLSSFLRAPPRADGSPLVDSVIITVAPMFSGEGIGFVPRVCRS